MCLLIIRLYCAVLVFTLSSLIVQIAVADEFPPRSAKPSACERVKVSHCQGIGYNLTRFPNLVGHNDGESAAEDFATFEPLISVQCSEELKFFLCSVYFPMCTEKLPGVSIGPCQTLCGRVERSCVKVLKDFGFPWPETLNCSKFPAVNKDDSMCMDGASSEKDEDAEKTPPRRKQMPETRTEYFSLGRERDVNYVEELKKYVLPGQTCLLPSAMVYVNRTATCVPLCRSNHGFKQSEMGVARSLIVVVAILNLAISTICLLCTLVRHYLPCTRGAPSPTAAGLMTANSGIYPNGWPMIDQRSASLRRRGSSNCNIVSRVMLHSSLAFASSASVTLIGLLNMEKISCTSYNWHSLFIVGSGMQHIPCTLTATLLYFTGTASRIWWVLLCYSRKWVMAREQTSSIFRLHLLAWGPSLFLCTLALMTKDAISADPLSSLCLVGGAVRLHHQIFIIARDVSLTVLAVLLIIAGYVRTAGGHHTAKSSGARVSHSGSFSGVAIGILFAIASACCLGAYGQSLAGQAQSLDAWNFANLYKSTVDSCFGVIFGCAHFCHFVYFLFSSGARKKDETHYYDQVQQRSLLEGDHGVQHSLDWANGTRSVVPASVDDRSRTLSVQRTKPSHMAPARLMEVSVGDSNTQSLPLPPPPSIQTIPPPSTAHYL